MVQLYAAEGVSLDGGPHLRHHASRRPDPGPGYGGGGEAGGVPAGRARSALSDGGGGVTTYQNANGSAVFRSDGTFDVVIDQGDESADTLCRAFCRAFHYDGLTFSLEGTEGTAAALQTYNGAPVVNCAVTFTISGGRVTAVSGTHLPQEGQSAGGDGALSALGALNAFLGTVQSGAVVTAVTDLYLCYELQSTIATPMALVPAWCIVTDTAKLLCKLLYRGGLRRDRRPCRYLPNFPQMFPYLRRFPPLPAGCGRRSLWKF